jgi:hypothetical protein
MKKQIIILLLFSLQLSAQNKDANRHFPKLKISIPCNQGFLNNYKGKWLIPEKSLVNSPGNNYSQEAMHRITHIHELVKQIYSEPIGSDAYWRGTYLKSDFAYTIKYVTEDGRTQEEYLKQRDVEGWSYYMVLFAWFCSKNANEIWNGYPEAGGGNAMTVSANYLTVLTGEFMDDDIWTIDDRPIKTKMPAIGRWKGYDVMATNGGYYADQNNEWFILVSRNDMLPYIPVTRKQYLERAITYITKFFNNLIASNGQIHDKTERDENTKRNREAKDIAVKNLRDELQKTTNEGLLSAPAFVRRDALFQTEGQIFLSEKDGGVLLATENPNYFRKDLPSYIPQFFVLSWSWGTKKWETDFRKAIEENFPIDELKAMIDK